MLPSTPNTTTRAHPLPPSQAPRWSAAKPGDLPSPGAIPSAHRRRARGISIMEMLIALAISAMLLTAVTVALNASFYAYASAAESASTHSSTRLVMQRMMHMIRTTTEHDAYDPADPALTLLEPGLGPLHSPGLQMIDPRGRWLLIWWAPNPAYDDDRIGDLWYGEGATRIEAEADPQPLLERVRARTRPAPEDDQPYVFTLTSRASRDGLLLRRATLDLTVQPGADATLALESAQGQADPVRLISSTMPRRNLR